MRAPLGLLVALLLTASLAGCLERRGTLTIELLVSDQGAIHEFQRIPFNLRDVRIDARTLNPETFPASTTRLELVEAAANQDFLPIFRQEVRADVYEKITLTTPPGATFQGELLDGTTVAVVVPGDALVQTNQFELPRGGATTYTFAVQVIKVESGTGAPSYRVVPLPEVSGAS
jgi:hypothetical protein